MLLKYCLSKLLHFFWLRIHIICSVNSKTRLQKQSSIFENLPHAKSDFLSSNILEESHLILISGA